MEESINKAQAPKRHLHIVFLVMLIFFVISLVTNILNSIIVDVKKSFDLSLVMTGFLPFSFFIAYGIMSIPAGFLSERFGSKILLSFSFLLNLAHYGTIYGIIFVVRCTSYLKILELLLIRIQLS